jgi:polysaccharide deacetylase family protein (PEP-CTERM system associated)
LVINALTIDVEDWFQATYLGVPDEDWSACESRIMASTRRVLGILEESEVKATFFILGWIAEREPELVRMIAADGHEIASHGYSHRQVFKQSSIEFARDLRLSIELIQAAADVSVRGYRAPAFSISAGQGWAFEVMVDHGILYDSSILPVRTPLYGMRGVPRFAHRVCEGHLLEIPLATVEVGPVRLPISGGVYTRLLPMFFITWAIRRLNEVEEQPGVLYLHPWELDPQPPSRGRNAITRWSHTVNKSKMEGRMRHLLARFSFGSIRDVFNLQG